MRHRVINSLLPNKAGIVGWTILLIIIATAALASWIAPHDPLDQDLSRRAAGPTISLSGLGPYPLGNDQLGRDLLSRIVYGGRPPLVIGALAVLIGGAIGTFLGMNAGFFGGITGRVIMRLADVQLSFPSILLALVIIAVLRPNPRNLVIVLALSGWPTYARVIRSEVLSIREREFVQAARAMGAGTTRIILEHVFPNVAASIIVVGTLDLARVVLLEAALSFLGLGIQPPTPDWGGMLADGRAYIGTEWWLPTFPGLALMLLVFSVNLVGDWLRDYLDPRLNVAT